MYLASLKNNNTHTKKKKKKKEEEQQNSCQNLPDVWALRLVSGRHSQRSEWEMLLNQLPCGHPDKTAS